MTDTALSPLAAHHGGVRTATVRHATARGPAGHRRWLDIVTWSLVFALALVVSVLFVVPPAIGGAQLTVLTGSMLPTLSPGDVIVTRSVESPRDIHVGDIITYAPAGTDPTTITHRVVSIAATGAGTTYTLRGDANTAEDKPISFDQVRGTFVYRVPKAGWAVEFLARNKLALGAGVGALWAATAVVRLRRKEMTK